MKDKRLLILNKPELMKEWHTTKNKSVLLSEITVGSSKKVWWLCEKGHEWEAIVFNRSKGKGCPFCAGQKVCADNCLANVNPKLALEWNYIKNDMLKPSDVTCGTNRKVWWKCKAGHEWEAAISDRNNGTGCPYCSGRYASEENNLANRNPTLANEWHTSKNGELTPKDFTPNSAKKVWWKCEKGHEWQATIDNRSKGSNCPYCNGKKVCTDNSLVAINSQLAQEWHPTKNGTLSAFDVTIKSNKTIWWKCGKGHEWKATVNSRSSGRGCPYCAGRYASKANNLEILNPDLAKEWHPHKNESLMPADITSSSGKKVWWKCENGHVWQDTVNHRKNGRGCPFCSKKRVTRNNSLANVNIKISQEWHPTKNGSLKPIDVTCGSHKRVWWICEEGHEWKTTIKDRNDGSSCPYCSGRYASEKNNLEVLRPDLAKEWHPFKNRNLAPTEFTLRSNKKVWWECKNGHEWQATVNNRSSGTGCPYCSGKKVCASNSLASINPQLAKEWHPSKNGALTPQDVTISSGKSVWWKCEKGHEWKARIYSRSNGIGCPQCSSWRRTSFPEQAIFYCLKRIFKSTVNRCKIVGKKGVEVDVFIHELNLAIEYDGLWYHSKKTSVVRDEKKNKLLFERKVNLIRIREDGLPDIDAFDSIVFIRENPNSDQSLENVIINVIEYIQDKYDLDNFTFNLIEKVKKISLKEEKNGIYDLMKFSERENSLFIVNPELAKEWHPTKNGDLTPNLVFGSAGLNVWWRCEKGHEWKATINNRAKGRGCPFCAGKKACEDNCLANVNPKLASQWHKENNGCLTPLDVTFGTGKKVWWICEKGHEWKATVASRSNGNGCPLCFQEKRRNKTSNGL